MKYILRKKEIIKETKGFKIAAYREREKHPGRYGTELLLTNVPYTTFINIPGRPSFGLNLQSTIWK